MFAIQGTTDDCTFDTVVSKSCLVSTTGVLISGLGDGDGAGFRIARGGSMLKISSSGLGGPYESNGSGIEISIGSKIGSDLENSSTSQISHKDIKTES